MAVASATLMAGGDLASYVQVEPAKTGFYVGANYAGSTTNCAATDGKADGAGVLVGYDFGKVAFVDVAGELRGSRIAGETVVSTFVKPGYDFGIAKVYGLAGYEKVTTYASDFDFAYGAGVSKEVLKDVEVFADVVDGQTVNTLTAGVNYKF